MFKFAFFPTFSVQEIFSGHIVHVNGGTYHVTEDGVVFVGASLMEALCHTRAVCYDEALVVKECVREAFEGVHSV